MNRHVVASEAYLSTEVPDPVPASSGLEVIVDATSRVLMALRVSPGPQSDVWRGQLRGLMRLAEDRERRRSAMARAAQSGWEGDVHLQILAASCTDRDVCGMALLADARTFGLSPERIVLEISETEEIGDPQCVADVTRLWRSMGFRSATRHFGGGVSGLSLLLTVEPSVVCLDGAWIRRVAVDNGTRIIVAGMVNTCRELGCEVIADGIISERLSEALSSLGVHAQSGPLFSGLAPATVLQRMP